MAITNILKGRIGIEDIRFGGGTFNRGKSDGSTQQMTEFSLSHILPGWVNVKDFGAVGDGATDDTQAIQDAIDSLEGLTGVGGTDQEGVGGVVYFPPGKYLTSAPLTVDHADHQHNITFQGVGPIASIIYNANSAGAHAIHVHGISGDSVHGFAMRDMSVWGNVDSGIGVLCEKTIRQVDFERVDIRNHGSHALYLRDTCNMVTIMKCRIWTDDSSDFHDTLATGIKLNVNSEQVWMYGNSVRGFKVGIEVGSFANAVGIYGGDIHGCIDGLAFFGSDNSDGMVTDGLVIGVYFERNGEDINISNDGSTYKASNIMVLQNSFSQTTGLDGTYKTGSAKTGQIASVRVQYGERCRIIGNRWRKIGTSDPSEDWSSNVESLVLFDNQSEDCEASDNVVASTVTFAGPYFLNEGTGNHGSNNF